MNMIEGLSVTPEPSPAVGYCNGVSASCPPQFPFLLSGVLQGFRWYSSHCQIKAVGFQITKEWFISSRCGFSCSIWVLSGCRRRVSEREAVSRNSSAGWHTCLCLRSLCNSSVQKNLDSLVLPPAPPLKAQISPLANMFNPEPRSPLTFPSDCSSGTPQATPQVLKIYFLMNYRLNICVIFPWVIRILSPRPGQHRRV